VAAVVFALYTGVQGRNQPNTAGGGGRKNLRWGQIFINIFKLWSEKSKSI